MLMTPVLRIPDALGARPMRGASRIRMAECGFVAATAIVGVSNTGHAAEETESLKELVVTGSRIATPELESMTPVMVLSNQAIEASGALNISDYLRDLPS